MDKIETNAVKQADKYICPKCGNDKFNLEAHLDTTYYYLNQYKCIKCGTLVTVKIKREII